MNESKIKSLIEGPLSKIDIRVDSVSYFKEGKMNILRITIDKDTYIDIDNCVEATKIINPILDNEIITEEQYILDVCSKEKGGIK